MMSKPTVSIIIVCYNYGHLVHRALEAIARQTFRDFEVVFVDNGCTDDSVAVVKKFEIEHPNITCKIVTVEKNIGYAYGNEVGAKAAEGEFMLFNDADDWMDDNCLEVLVSAARKDGADRVIGAYREVDENGKLLRNRTFGEHPNRWVCDMQQANLFSSSVYRKNKLKQYTSWADTEKTMQFSKCSSKVAYVNIPCYNYLVNLNSITKKKNVYKSIHEKEASWENIAKSYRVVYNALTCDDDKAWCEYESLRKYFIYIYQYLLKAPLKTKWNEYAWVHGVMEDVFPHYLKNSKISIFRKEGDLMFSKTMVWISASAEKLHMMKLLLLFFHIAYKLKIVSYI